MTFKQLVKTLTELEGAKHQINVAQMSEIVRCIKDIAHEDTCGVLKALDLRAYVEFESFNRDQ